MLVFVRAQYTSYRRSILPQLGLAFFHAQVPKRFLHGSLALGHLSIPGARQHHYFLEIIELSGIIMDLKRASST